MNAFFSDLEAKKCINLLLKEDIFDLQLFFKVEYSKIESAFETLEPKVLKKEVLKKVKEVKEKYEKDGKITYRRSLDEGQKKKVRRSST